MTGLPKDGAKVRIWPFPGRRVQNGPRPVDFLGGGRFLPLEGEEIIWTPFHLEQLRSGDILLHAPPAPVDPMAPVEAPKFAPKTKKSEE